MFLQNKAPQIPSREPFNHLLSDKKYEGISEEVLNNEELIKMYLPVIKSDFAVLEIHKYKNEEKLIYPITAFGGISDKTLT